MECRGLFIGLTTLDNIYLSKSTPQANQKIVALDYLNAAGGPATNAAVVFSHLGNKSSILSVLGQHPISQIIRNDLQNSAVEIIDLIPEKLDSPPISSIVVSASTGDRSIISINAVKSQAKSSRIPNNVLTNINVVLIDGHQMEVSLTLSQLAKSQHIPIVVDGGSWKPGFELVLALADYIICSANFLPPECINTQDVFKYLQKLKIPHIAITQGEKPIRYWEAEQIKTISIPKIKAVDTLGAGDIFHGAFCHYILQTDFATALTKASQIASKSCQFFGTRSWQNFI